MTLARPLIDAGRLLALFDARLKADHAHDLVYPPRSQNHAGLAAFREWLLQEARLYADADAAPPLPPGPAAPRRPRRPRGG